MNDPGRVDSSDEAKAGPAKSRMSKARGAALWTILGLLAGGWVAGGPDRYGEEEGFVGGLRGAGRTAVKSFHYSSAMLRDCLSQERSSVRKLGLAQQIETRLWQDKRLVAEGIIVEISEEGTAVLKGIVPEAASKEMAVSLTRDTRGVERVVDELAVRPSSRTITATPADPVPTGVASRAPFLR